MITVLQYLVIAAAIGLVVFFLAVLVFGRGEQMAPLPARTSPAELPGGAVSGDNIRAVRFAVGVRGYRMGDVDWTLDRMADELDRLRAEVRALGGDPDRIPEERMGELLPVPSGEAPVGATSALSADPSATDAVRPDPAPLSPRPAAGASTGLPEPEQPGNGHREFGGFTSEAASTDQPTPGGAANGDQPVTLRDQGQ